MFRVDERDFSDARPPTGFAWVASLASQIAPTEASDKLTNVRLYFAARSFVSDAVNGAAGCRSKRARTNRAKAVLSATSHLQIALRAAPRRTRISVGLR